VRNRILFYLLPLVVVILFLSACGQSSFSLNQQSPDPSSDTGSPAEVGVNDVEGDTAIAAGDAEVERVENQAAGGDAAKDYFLDAFEESSVLHEGIPVGFTSEGRPYRGNPEAPVLLEEFSDFQCPYCSRFTQQTMPALLENQISAGEVSLVYYDFPLENIHPQAFAAANAARCAGEQGAEYFWLMHDMLYENSSEWGISEPDPVFVSFAEELGLDAERFEICQSELRYSGSIRNDIDHATSRGVRSTPSFFLNNQPLIGAQPLGAFNEAIALVSNGESIAAAAPEAPEAPESPLQPPPTKPEPVAIDMENVAAVLGDPDAPVTIVEFTDYQCPYCLKYVEETLPSMVADQIATGEVYYVLKDLPLDSIHPSARGAARAARCAGEQNAYWEMHDALFESQETWANLPDEAFLDLASTLDLDREAFTNCLESEEASLAVQENVDEAMALGANSTPFFFVDGLPIPGAQPYELFEYAIGEAKEGRLADAYVPSEPNLENAHGIGDPNAPVTIVEFTDYQCPYCSRYFEQSFNQIKENYIDTGKVYYIFKDFPLQNIHPQATKAAEAARCAAEQNAYLAMHDELFANQSLWSGSPDAVTQFKQFAQDLGLDADAFNTCLDSGRMEELVLADLQDGTSAGVNGTPAFFINRHSMSGAQPYIVFEEAIEQFLADEG
jgi:protein-disulfide isomerase